MWGMGMSGSTRVACVRSAPRAGPLSSVGLYGPLALLAVILDRLFRRAKG